MASPAVRITSRVWPQPCIIFSSAPCAQALPTVLYMTNKSVFSEPPAGFARLNPHFPSNTPRNSSNTPQKTHSVPGIKFSESGKTTVMATMLNRRILFHSLHKYMGWTFVVFLFFSCSKHVAQLDTAHQTNTAKTEAKADSAALAAQTRYAPTGVALHIDTLKHPLDKSTVVVPLKDAYYTQRVQEKVQNFYATNGYKTKWLEAHVPNALYNGMIEMLKNAYHYGLQPETYGASNIEERVANLYRNEPVSEADIVDLDIQISRMYFLFTTHLMEGRMRTASPGSGRNIWLRDLRDYKPEDVATLAAVNTADQLSEAVRSAQPVKEEYVRLQRALDHYQALAKNTPIGLPAITMAANQKIKPDEHHNAIPLVRRKLGLTNMTSYAAPMDSLGQTDSLLYDAALASAIRWFQVRHGLEPDGIIGEKTLKFLNQSFQEKAALIALNMERMRWAPESYGDNYLRVNIPEYMMRVYNQNKKEMEMRVIVGAPDKATPVFNDELGYIVFAPTWTVPNSIIKEEIIPKLRKDPAHYKNYSFYKNEAAIDPVNEVWDSVVNPYQYRVVQQPGPDNSLGLVKFLLGNTMSVYLHDTPNHRLFNKSYRALSHGCVRLDEPTALAEYLLRDQKGWNKDAIGKAMHATTPAGIPLRKHYPVYIEYCTAWVDENGQINFREDIYGHDRRQLQQLFPAAKDIAAVAGL